MSLFKTVSLFSKMFLGIELLSSYSLLVFPRLIMCLISFMNDYSVYKICEIYNLKKDIRLMTLASSGVILTFGSRTFSNTIEMALCSILLYIVSECMIHSNTVIYQKEFLEEKYAESEKIGDRVKYFKMRMSLPHYSYRKCFILATLCVLGIFNRPTFVLFGMPIVFHWMLRGMGSKSVSFLDFNLRMLLFIASGIPVFCVIVLIDSLYYGYLTMAQIYIFDITIYNFLVTPVNFIRYNINPENTGAHGEHPKWLHMLVNIPLLFNIIGVIALFSFGTMFYKFCKKEFQNLPQSQSFVSLMTSAVFIPVLLLSLFNHQEARFLIPITVPIIMLHSPKLITGINVTSFLKESQLTVVRYISNYVNITISGKLIMKLWYASNIIFTLFFGFVHQGGAVKMANHFSKVYQALDSTTQIHLITSHIYNIPESLFVLPSARLMYSNANSGQKYRMPRRFFIHEYGGMDLEAMFFKMKLLLDVSEMKATAKKQTYNIYLAIPTSKSFDLKQLFFKHHSLIAYSEENIFYPHLSTEAFPTLHSIHPCEMSTDVDELDRTCSLADYEEYQDTYSVSSILRKISSVTHQFGLAVYKIEVKHGKRNPS